MRMDREATSLDTPTVLLELGRRHIPQGGVQPLLIVDAFPELTDLRVGVSQVAVLAAIDLFVLQRFHERLAGRVVIGVFGTVLLDCLQRSHYPGSDRV